MTLQLPSILGTAHGDFHDSPEPPLTPSPSPSPAQGLEECAEDPPADPTTDTSPTAAHSATPRLGPTAPLHDSAAVLFPDLSDTEAERGAVAQVPTPFTADSYTYDWKLS